MTPEEVRSRLEGIYGRPPPSHDVSIIASSPKNLLPLAERIAKKAGPDRCSLFVRQWPLLGRYDPAQKETLAEIVLQGGDRAAGMVAGAAHWVSESACNLDDILGEAKSLGKLGAPYLCALPSILPYLAEGERRQLARLVQRSGDAAEEVLRTAESSLHGFEFATFRKATSYILRQGKNRYSCHQQLIRSAQDLIAHFGYRGFCRVARTISHVSSSVTSQKDPLRVLLSHTKEIVAAAGWQGYSHVASKVKNSHNDEEETASALCSAIGKVRLPKQELSTLLCALAKARVDNAFITNIPELVRKASAQEIAQTLPSVERLPHSVNSYELEQAIALRRTVGKAVFDELMEQRVDLYHLMSWRAMLDSARRQGGEEHAGKVAGLLHSYGRHRSITWEQSLQVRIGALLSDEEVIGRLGKNPRIGEEVLEIEPSDAPHPDLYLPMLNTLLATLASQNKHDILQAREHLKGVYEAATEQGDGAAGAAIYLRQVRLLADIDKGAGMASLKRGGAFYAQEGLERSARQLARLRELAPNRRRAVGAIAERLPELLGTGLSLDEIVRLASKRPSPKGFAHKLAEGIAQLREAGGEALAASGLDFYTRMAERSEHAPWLFEVLPRIHSLTGGAASGACGVALVEGVRRSVSLTRALLSYSLLNTEYLVGARGAEAAADAWRTVTGLSRKDWRAAGAYWVSLTEHEETLLESLLGKERLPPAYKRELQWWNSEKIPYKQEISILEFQRTERKHLLAGSA